MFERKESHLQQLVYRIFWGVVNQQACNGVSLIHGSSERFQHPIRVPVAFVGVTSDRDSLLTASPGLRRLFWCSLFSPFTGPKPVYLTSVLLSWLPLFLDPWPLTCPFHDCPFSFRSFNFFWNSRQVSLSGLQLLLFLFALSCLASTFGTCWASVLHGLSCLSCMWEAGQLKYFVLLLLFFFKFAWDTVPLNQSKYSWRCHGWSSTPSAVLPLSSS